MTITKAGNRLDSAAEHPQYVERRLIRPVSILHHQHRRPVTELCAQGGKHLVGATAPATTAERGPPLPAATSAIAPSGREVASASHPPSRTTLDRRTLSTNARIVAVLPTPASPATSTKRPRPAFTSENAPCSAASASSRSSSELATTVTAASALFTQGLSNTHTGNATLANGPGHEPSSVADLDRLQHPQQPKRLALIIGERDDTAGACGMAEIVVPEGIGSPWHVHPEEDEWFYVLEGSITFWVADTRLSLKAGSFAFGPKGVPHTFYADEGGVRALAGFAPMQFEGFQREAGEPAAERVLPPPMAGHPDMARLASIAKRNGFEILGQPGPRPATNPPPGDVRPLSRAGATRRSNQEESVSHVTITPTDDGPCLIDAPSAHQTTTGVAGTNRAAYRDGARP